MDSKETEDEEDVTTPGQKSKSVSFFLSPSAANICIMCHCDITAKYPYDHDNSNKLKLWKGQEKTKVCSDIESYLGQEIKKNKDFQAICKSCYNKIKTQIKNLKEKTEMLDKGRLLVDNQFLRCRSKRLKFSTPANADDDQGESSKKRLRFESQNSEETEDQISKIKVQIVYGNQHEEHFVIPNIYEGILKTMCSKDISEVLKLLYSIHKDKFIATVNKIVTSEVTDLCKVKNKDSPFRLADVANATKVSYIEQYELLQKEAPLLKEVLTSAAINTKADKRNILKKSETLIPSIANAASILLFTRNRTMNANATLNSLVMRRGKANKMCFMRFNGLNMSLSYMSLLAKQLELGKDYLAPVKELSSHLTTAANSMLAKLKSDLDDEELEMSIELSHEFIESSMSLYSSNADESFLQQGALNPSVDLINVSSTSTAFTADSDSSDDSFSEAMPNWSELNCTIRKVNQTQAHKTVDVIDSIAVFNPKFMIVGDNVDIRTKRRRYLISRTAIDRHFFNVMVVSNKIEIPQDLIGRKAPKIKNMYDVPLSYFFPNNLDENALREEIKTLISRDLVTYFKDLSWMKKHVTKHIPHQYSKEATLKSTVFPCGVIDQNENSTEGIIEIMKMQHQLVPGHGSDNLCRIFSVGDLLTVERLQNAQEDLRDGPTASTRLEGLIPALADFHTYGNFMEVIWHILYDTSSSMDIGTLFQARNFLNARTVTSSPMKEINSCEELLLKYSEAMLLAAFNQYTKDNQLELVDQKDDKKNIEQMNKVLEDFMVKVVTTEVPDYESASTYQCPYCKGSYKKVASLRKHINSKHQKQTSVLKKKQAKKQVKKKTEEDCVQNYSKNALFLCYLIKNFIDARKHGDGARLLRIYKFLLIYFKIDGRTKYSFQSLHLLAQVNLLLPPPLAHELTWNRFVNIIGRVDTNVELDRHLEHLNKYVKADLAQYQGKITEKSVARCSRSYYKIEQIIDSIDQQLDLKLPSGRHSSASWEDDVNELAAQYTEAGIFDFQSGRFHSRFPGFPKNYPSKLNILNYKTWVYSKLRQFSKLNIYQQDDIVTS